MKLLLKGKDDYLTGAKLYNVLALNIRNINLDHSFNIQKRSIKKNLIQLRESELIRILLKPDEGIKTKAKFPTITSLIVLNVNKSVQLYYDDNDPVHIKVLDHFRLNVVDGDKINSIDYAADVWIGCG